MFALNNDDIGSLSVSTCVEASGTDLTPVVILVGLRTLIPTDVKFVNYSSLDKTSSRVLCSWDDASALFLDCTGTGDWWWSVSDAYRCCADVGGENRWEAIKGVVWGGNRQVNLVLVSWVRFEVNVVFLCQQERAVYHVHIETTVVTYLHIISWHLLQT